MFAHLRTGVAMLAVLTVLTGGLYPLAVTALAEAAFSAQAHGSLIERDGRVIGSDLIAQRFSSPGYFQPRPSVAGTDGFDAGNSGASNLGPTSRVLRDTIEARRTRLKAENPMAQGPVPIDLLTASGSGLDPHVSPAAAEFQVPRVARARALEEAHVRHLIATHTADRTLAFLGEPRVNVLRLNMALDEAR